MRAYRAGSQSRVEGFFFAVGILALAGRAEAAAALKVTCVGEQSTHSGHPAAGTGHEWPDELGTLLGAGYAVDNDGDNGHSSALMNDTGATPVPFTNNGGSYENPANALVAGTNGGYVRSIMPHDVVVIGPWGMHDTKMMMGNALPNTQARFQQDYDYLVSLYMKLTPKPKIILTTPLPFPVGGNVTTDTQTYMKDAIDPAVRAVATKYNLPLVDLFAIFTAAPATQALLASDGGVNLAGTQKIAMLVAAAITGGSTGTDAGVPDASVPKDAGTAGAGGGGGSAGAAGGAGGSTTGTAGAGGSTVGSAGTGGGTTGTAGMMGSTSGAAGTGGGTTGSAGSGGGTTTGSAGTSGGSASGSAGTGVPARSSSGGGCSVGGNATTGALVSVLFAMALVLPGWRRRRRGL